MKLSLPAVVRTAPRVALSSLVIFSLWTGARGLNFGTHWDEESFFRDLTNLLKNTPSSRALGRST